MPCFDEADTVTALVVWVLASPWTAQVIVVDDGSTDGTAKVLADLIAELGDPRLDVVTHEHNRGKERRCAVPSPESPASTSSSRMPT